MSLSLQASADGLSVELLLGATVIGQFSAAGIEAGALLASDAEAQGLASLTKLLSPEKLAKAFMGANQSLAGNGYQILPGGLIVQWGRGSGPANVGVGGSIIITTTTLPIAFPTARLANFVSGDVVAGVGDTNEGFLHVQSSTTTVIQLVFTRTAGAFTSGQTVGFSWLVIGY